MYPGAPGNLGIDFSLIAKNQGYTGKGNPGTSNPKSPVDVFKRPTEPKDVGTDPAEIMKQLNLFGDQANIRRDLSGLDPTYLDALRSTSPQLFEDQGTTPGPMGPGRWQPNADDPLMGTMVPIDLVQATGSSNLPNAKRTMSGIQLARIPVMS